MKTQTKLLVTYILASALGILLPFLSIAQTSKAQDKFFVTVNVEVQDSLLLQEGYIDFNFYSDGVNSINNLNVDNHKYAVQKKSIKLIIPISRAVVYGYLDYTFKKQTKIGGTRQPINVNNRLYIFEAGDEFNIILDRGSIRFDGREGKKYTCIEKLSQHIWPKINQLSGITNSLLDKKLTKMAVADSIFVLKKLILEQYKAYITKVVYNLLLADLWANYNKELLTTILGDVQRDVNARDLTLESSKKLYVDYLGKFNRHFLPDSVLSQSYRYCDFLYWQEYLAEQAFGENTLTNNSTPPSFLRHQSIQKKKYSDLIRDKVTLINFLQGNIRKVDLDLIYKDVLSNATEYYKPALRKIIDSKRGEAYPFQLPDKYGKVHKFADFKGKLIVLDFWYTGCHNCAIQYTALKPIISGYKANPNIVFITVSIDGNKNKMSWLKSLEQEIYSGKDEINLLAQGKEDNLIKYYNITGYPTLIVISKEGNVISTSPPRPAEDATAFKTFLNTYL